MTNEKIKRMLDACYQAKRIREMLPPLPEGIMSSHIRYMDMIQELQKQNEIAERDERNVAIGNAAKAKGYDVMTFAFGAMLLFSVLMEADLALTLVMVAVYLFIQFYSLWWRFKLEKEM